MNCKTRCGKVLLGKRSGMLSKKVRSMGATAGSMPRALKQEWHMLLHLQQRMEYADSGTSGKWEHEDNRSSHEWMSQSWYEADQTVAQQKAFILLSSASRAIVTARNTYVWICYLCTGKITKARAPSICVTNATQAGSRGSSLHSQLYN